MISDEAFESTLKAKEMNTKHLKWNVCFVSRYKNHKNIIMNIDSSKEWPYIDDTDYIDKIL